MVGGVGGIAGGVSWAGEGGAREERMMEYIHSLRAGSCSAVYLMSGVGDDNEAILRHIWVPHEYMLSWQGERVVVECQALRGRALSRWRWCLARSFHHLDRRLEIVLVLLWACMES